MQELFGRIAPMIGHTPLLEITFRYRGRLRRIFAKAEWFNMTGSIKDRVAHYILERAYQMGEIVPGQTIAEATSGNTGISFSALGTLLGHPVVIYMPDWMSAERICLMESYGAQVKLVSREEGGFLGSIAMAEELGKQGAYLPRQFSNEDNVIAHEKTTAEEIVGQLKSLGLTADGVVAGVGTGGTVMGLGNRLRAENPACRVHPLEPENSPTLSTGHKVGKHRIYGISDEFIPDIVKLDQLSSVVSVDDGDAIAMAQMLSRKLGLGVGVSSGANFLGCVKAQEELGADSTFVTVFADDSKKYLSTDYAKAQESAKRIWDEIELIGVTAHPCK
ncbi:MAG: cysteine synthase family protein [Ruminococcaceae bacterium]|nr:cysteine synthase family protein [Oscillospiraceae bacterium]